MTDINTIFSRSSFFQLHSFMVLKHNSGSIYGNPLLITMISMILNPISTLLVPNLHKSPNQERSKANAEICRIEPASHHFNYDPSEI